jgi:cysteine dioxygenase
MNLSDLIKNINENIHQKSNLKSIISEVKKYDDVDWKNYVKINKNRYNKELVYKNELFDIYIVTWNKKQKSSIHNHPEYGCVYKVLKGIITEYLFDPNIETIIKTNKLNENDIGYIHDNIGYHYIENNTDDISVSLHIYKPPNFSAIFNKKI